MGPRARKWGQRQATTGVALVEGAVRGGNAHTICGGVGSGKPTNEKSDHHITNVVFHSIPFERYEVVSDGRRQSITNQNEL